MKKYLPALVAGFGAGVLQIVPIAKNLTCCLIVPAAVVIALVLDRKANNDHSPIISSKAVAIGALTGLFAALFGTFFEVLVTFITKHNDIVNAVSEFRNMFQGFMDEEVVDQAMGMLYGMVEDIQTSGFSFMYAVMILFGNLFVNIIFGIIGGLIGMQILNARYQNPK